MTKSIFAYGSFAEGMPHYSRLAKYVLKTTPAYVFGTLARFPHGLPILYPEGTQKICGQVCELKDFDSALAMVDHIMGFSMVEPNKSSILRSVHAVSTVDSDVPQMIETYLVNPQKLPQGTQWIPDGDWQASWQKNPPLFSRLTEGQKTYIQKLGSCSGRDIVPINLTLYRELISLQLVVDKGRRLALTSLGQDVFRQL